MRAMNAIREELLAILAPAKGILQGLLLWEWKRVAGSRVAHLCPPSILQGSRTACGALSVYDVTIEIFGQPLGGLRCMRCSAWGEK